MESINHTIKLIALLHKEKTWIGIKFPRLPVLQRAVQKTSQLKWSHSHKCWYLPFTRESYNELLKNVDSFAYIDNSELKQQKIVHAKNNARVSSQSMATNVKSKVSIRALNHHVLPLMRQTLMLKGYSPATIKTYLNEMSCFLQAIGATAADTFSVNRIKDYLLYCLEKLNLSENTLHSRINALKFYYEQVLKKEKCFWEIPRPKKPMQLPKLLNQKELVRLFGALTNKKHKAMLFTIYSAGLRVSELASLKITDIDSHRMQIFIQNAKGKKDRYVNLSPILLDLLRSYIKEYTPRPNVYLFESEQTGMMYPVRTIQQIFQNARHRAGICGGKIG